jgi:hypothetical protein
VQRAGAHASSSAPVRRGWQLRRCPRLHAAVPPLGKVERAVVLTAYPKAWATPRGSFVDASPSLRLCVRTRWAIRCPVCAGDAAPRHVCSRARST